MSKVLEQQVLRGKVMQVVHQVRLHHMVEVVAVQVVLGQMLIAALADTAV
jgi:hypothetical protein